MSNEDQDNVIDDQLYGLYHAKKAWQELGSCDALVSRVFNSWPEVQLPSSGLAIARALRVLIELSMEHAAELSDESEISTDDLKNCRATMSGVDMVRAIMGVTGREWNPFETLAVKTTFRDAEGRRWQRDEDGVLKLTSEP